MSKNGPENSRNRVLRASEIGAFAFCAYAWWLGSVRNIQPDNVEHLKAGWVAHERHGRRVALSTGLTRVGYLLLLLAVVAAVLWLVNSGVG